MKRLEGGFINKVYLDEHGKVVKVFEGDNLVRVPAEERARREAAALIILGGIAAPRLIRLDGCTLYQEFIPGESYENMARQGKNVFEPAGKLLAKIHSQAPAIFKNLVLLDEKSYRFRFKGAANKTRLILEEDGVELRFPNIPWDSVYKFETTLIHGDFWLGNLIGKEGEEPRAIDWEFADIGSPFEDFAIADLWIFREFPGSEKDFWKGYGETPDKKAIDAFLVLKCLEFLATTTPESYRLEAEDGFYHNKIAILRTLI